jgi:hypothetical protein
VSVRRIRAIIATADLGLRCDERHDRSGQRQSGDHDEPYREWHEYQVGASSEQDDDND